MVRALIGFACIQQVFSDSVLMQTQSQSNHVLDVLHTGAGRVQKMQQNTQAMEDQYKALLQNIVSTGSLNDPNTGEPYLPNADFLDTVKKQFDALKAELVDEHDTNEGILKTASEQLAACNTARAAAFSNPTGVVVAKGQMTAARGSHSTCRTEENSAIDKMETSCNTFDSNTEKCNDDQDWYAQYDDESITAGGQPNTLKKVVDDAVVCANDVASQESKAVECDGLQTGFHTAYCNYEGNLRGACTQHDSCFTLQSSNLAASTKSVQDLEKEQKIIWKMVGKVECYLNELIQASVGSMPTQANIDACVGTVPSADILDIEVPAEIVKDACLQHGDLDGEHALPTYRPGKGNWYATEFGSDPFPSHNKLNDDGNCAR